MWVRKEALSWNLYRKLGTEARQKMKTTKWMRGVAVCFWWLCLLCGNAVANETVVDGVKWSYWPSDDGGASITGGGPNTGPLVIPSELDGYAVTSIGDCAFSGGWDVSPGWTEVVIPDCVTNLGSCAGWEQKV